MKQTNICFLFKDDKVLLGMKKRGFGVGKWNGFGGKLKEGEDIKTSMARELREEAGVNVLIEDLKEAGTLKFRFENNSDWDNYCHIFIATNWVGDPSESEEMLPRWYTITELPFDSMWVDDSHWLPLVLAGKKIEAEFLFNAEGENILNYKILEL